MVYVRVVSFTGNITFNEMTVMNFFYSLKYFDLLKFQLDFLLASSIYAQQRFLDTL